MISIRTLNIRISLLEGRLTALLIYNISGLSVIYITLHILNILRWVHEISTYCKSHSYYNSKPWKIMCCINMPCFNTMETIL